MCTAYAASAQHDQHSTTCMQGQLKNLFPGDSTALHCLESATSSLASTQAAETQVTLAGGSRVAAGDVVIIPPTRPCTVVTARLCVTAAGSFLSLDLTAAG